MASSPKSLETLLNGIAARLPLLEKSDLSPLSGINAELETIKERYELQTAFSTLIDRTIALVGNIIMSETPFDAGCRKLGESVAKMMKEAKKGAKEKDATTKHEKEKDEGTRAEKDAKQKDEATSARKTEDRGQGTGKKEPQSHRATELQESGDRGQENRNPINRSTEPPICGTTDQPIPDDLKDLVAKFASNQQAVLEDFEAYILEMEKGVPAAKAAIKRILHTWKGEFGVLDMQEYSKLVHEIEDRLESGRITGENLFRLKDFLLDRMNRFAQGKCPAISEAEREGLVGKAGEEKKEPRSYTAAEPQEKQETGDRSQGAGKGPGESAIAKTPDREFEGDASLLADFINESRDHIHTAETSLLELESDPSVAEKIDCVFRAWHTIKGVAGFLNLKEVQTLAHGMESIMDKARRKELRLHAQCIDLLLEGNDCLKNFLALVEEAMSSGTLIIPPNYDALMQRLSGPISNAAVPLAASPEKKIGEILIDQGALPPQKIQEALAKQQAGDQRKLGEILIEEHKVPAQAVGGALAAQGAARAGAIEETIRVPVNRIGALVDTIGEAVIAQSMIYAHHAIRAISDQSVHTKIAHAAMIMRQIQEMAMSLRMVSVKATFQKMARLARDLAKKFNREIEFTTEGEDTELDKSVVENIGDPLIHMIRNALDHGVEPPEERVKAGKPAKAIVKLRAYHRAGNIYIELSDDGRGLDRDAIYKKAISKGLCKADERLSDEETFRFIFLPGFSTAKVVTDVSGRGVGMDVVRRNIEGLRGSVEIASSAGKGTTFTIRLPLTLAIVDGMIVRAGAENYIIPTLAIIESLRPAENQIETVMQKGAIVRVRGDLIPLVHLESLFSKNGNGKSRVDYMTGIVMIVEDMLGKKLGLHLDEIVGQQQVVIKSLGEGMGDVPGVTGGAIMSDGNVSLILDVGGIVKLVQG
jgi:two-component system chemotaxis sensor kinase CheA